MIKKFREKPLVFKAVQYDGKNSDELKKLFEDEDECVFSVDGDILLIQTKYRSLMILSKGDWLIRDDYGAVFTKTDTNVKQDYEEV
jgi:hypothetical protein